MATKISVQKGGVSALTVVISYGVSVLSLYAVKKIGLAIPDNMQSELTMVGVTLLTGLYTGFSNWIKHRKK